MYHKIKNPETNKFVSIYGKTGQRVIQNYLNLVSQYAGEDTTTPNEYESATINELKTFLDNLDLTDQYIKELHQTFIDTYSDPNPTIENIIRQTLESWTGGKYYLGGQLQLSLEDKISAETIQTVKDIRMEKCRTYGGPCNSSEDASIQRSKNQLKIIENLLVLYKNVSIHTIK